MNLKNKAIYRLIRASRGLISKSELLEQSKLTGSTLTRILEELVQQGVILEAGFGDSTGGRKPVLYRINPQYGYVWGLDISRISSTLVLYDLGLNKLDSMKWRMSERTTPDYLIGQIASSVTHILNARGIAPETVIGMGIGSVGPLDRTTGTILRPHYFPASGWENVPIADRLYSLLGFPIMLENGTNMAIYGEYWSELDHKYRHLLYVHAGVGLRSAMMSNGSIVYGAVDMDSAIGQMIIQSDGPRLTADGNYGALEAYVSVPALEREIRAKLKQGRASKLTGIEPEPDKVQISHLLTALADEDPLVVELFTQTAVYFGIGLANLLNILHPEKVILGGPLLSGHPLFFETAVRTAQKGVSHNSVYQAEFSLGNLGDEALVYGAAAKMIDSWIEA